MVIEGGRSKIRLRQLLIAAADVCAAHQAHIKANADYYPTRLQHLAHNRFTNLQSTLAHLQSKHAKRVLRLDPKPELPEQFARDEMRMRNEASDARLEAVRLKEEVDELKEREAWLEAEVARLETDLSVPEPVSLDAYSVSNLDQALAQDLPPLPEPIIPEEVFVISTATQDGLNLGLDDSWEPKMLTDALWDQLE
ncbi:hypothetical protein BCR44DRAFT_1440406 [Catenaria anguillulae PL171]|uniref:Uncharacterized protein n=1 Tax=Catenaria anguillulae PL171 TaxID=765915 RepID=A0A1Y2HCV1_9FUNG|nr:hypothetical protein BCR44DRAFT_1440406 [Catenaria anguillulae PL171]